VEKLGLKPKINIQNIAKWVLALLAIPFLLPEEIKFPIRSATGHDWDPRSYWYYPWGESVTHKGVDIFAGTGTKLISPTYGLILQVGQNETAGNYIYLLGPKWRVHYFAHLDAILVSKNSLVQTDDILGIIGNTGNAKWKEPHLHYSLMTLIPYPWLYDETAVQGWKKIFYLNPETFFSHK
jgi:peptidoglycan LD-endopeptidase LytH